MTLNINRTVIILALFLVGALAVGFGFGKNSGPVYNPATVIRVSGIVTEVQNVAPGNPLPGWHLTVKNEEGTFHAYIGPGEFLKMLRTSFANGDHVKFVGSKISVGDTQVILVREITRKDVTITLREDDGAPVWENWGVPLIPVG